MSTALRLLILQDDQDDTELILAKLCKNGYDPDALRVDNEQGLQQALLDDRWQVVLCDYALSSPGSLDALALVRRKLPAVPFIMLSGCAGEERAVEAMRAGASDYIMMNQLTRLVPAIERELRDSSKRQERERAEDALYQERERALVTLHSIGDGVITTDAKGRIDYMNPVAEQVTGWKYAEAQGYPLMQVLPLINETTRHPIDSPAETCLRTGHVVSLQEECVLINRNAQEFHLEDSTAPIFDREGMVTGTVLVFHDVTRERRMAGQMAWQASHDNLTGLSNRVEFADRLDSLLEGLDAGERRHALLYLDLDQFKVVNDTCGHAAGDKMLQEISHNLRSQLPPSAALSRLGGDEFGVLLENVSLEQATETAYRLLTAIGEMTFSWENRRFDVAASIGLVPIDRDTPNASFALSAADLACYVAKDAGRNRVHVYAESDIEQDRRHSEMQWVSRIKEALEDSRLLLYSQDIKPLHDTALPPHHELLVRMKTADGRIVTPDSFIPAAERFNLMNALDRWVIDAAFSTVRELQHEENGALYSINLSGNSLNDPQLPAYLQHKILDYRLDPRRLCFEITETAAVFHLARTRRMIHSLKALGCRFSLDDFGSGLSSFSYLKNLPVDYIKIDGSFVRDMDSDPMNRAIVEAINQVGHTLGIHTIGEYVENRQIADELQDIGVDFAQGYHFSKPQPLDGIGNIVPFDARSNSGFTA